MPDPIKTPENEIADLKLRNTRVEADKAWEVSSFRIGTITIITYIVAACLLYAVGAKNIFVSALVPALGYWLSTQSLPIIKRWWIKKYLTELRRRAKILGRN